MTKDRDDRKPRIAEPQRRQGVIRFEMPEDTLPESHRTRVLWDVVGTLDLGTFLRNAKAVDGTAGRTTLSPRMKLVLWLYAISTGVGSAREIARLVRNDDADRGSVGRSRGQPRHAVIVSCRSRCRARRADDRHPRVAHAQGRAFTR